MQVKWLSKVLPPVVMWLRFEDPLSLGLDSSINEAKLLAQNLDQVRLRFMLSATRNESPTSYHKCLESLSTE